MREKAAAPTERPCAYCEKPFTPKPHSRSDTKWCSKLCAAAGWSSQAPDVYTGACAVCGIEVPFPRRYCDRVCRNRRGATGRTMGQYVCEYCGKVVERRANDARRQHFCSHRCHSLSLNKSVAVPDLDPAFGNWLAGFVDGEGCFTLRTAGLGARFHITLRADDMAIHEEIRHRLGFGRIYGKYPPSAKAHGNERPQSVFACANVPECAALVAIFERFPLRAKKARDFAIWAKAVRLLDTDGPVDQGAFAVLAHAIVEVRQYRD